MSRSLTPFAALAALLLPVPALLAQDTPGPAEPAYLDVKVPADAKLQVGDHVTQQTGQTRRFRTPALKVDASKKYTYTLKATFKDKDGKEVVVEETVQVTPGKTTEVDLTKPKEAVARGPDGTDKPKEGDKAKRPPDVIWVASPQAVVDEMLKVADVKKDDLLYDLGCGDGIIVVTAAKNIKCKAVGYDIDPKVVKMAKERVKEAKVEDLVTIEEKDIFTLDLTKATVIATYLLDDLNKKLVAQFKEMKPGTRIVMHDYDIPGYKPDKTTKVTVKGRDHKIFLYTIPLNKSKE